MVGVSQDSDEKQEKNLIHNQGEYLLAQQKAQQIKQENASVQQERERAPSALKSDSFQTKEVRAEAAQDAQQAYFGGGFQQKGSSADQFAGAREAALKSGKFDYSSVRSSFYSPPSNFVSSKGERVTRSSPAPEPVSFGTPVSGTPVTSSKSPVLKISQAELEKSNALRASQGLPALEKVTTVQIVTPTRGQTKTVSTPPTLGQPQDLRAKLAQAQGTLQPSGGEAVSFLRFPFSPNKGSSSGGIQSTTILDPLQFLGVEAGVNLAAKGGSALLTLLKGEAKTLIKTGTADIGLNIKPSEAYLKAKSFESQASKLPQPASVKAAKIPTVPTFTSTEITLGRGIGSKTGKGGATSASDLFKPSPPSKPSTTTGNKEVTVGKGGLTQIVREKPQVQKSKTVSTMKEQEVKLGTGQVKQIQKQDQILKEKLQPKTEQRLQQKQTQDTILKQIQKTRILPRPKQEQTQGLVLPIPTKTKQTQQPRPKQKQKMTGLIPTPPPAKNKTRPTTVPTFIQRTTPKQKQGGGYPKPIPHPTISTLFIPTPPPPRPGPIPKPTPTETTPPDTKKTPPFGILTGGAKSGGLGKVSKYGSRKGFIGNVPLESIVGVYKREEISYGKTAENLARGSGSKQKYGGLSTKSKTFKFR